jgi:hypothetical protein
MFYKTVSTAFTMIPALSDDKSSRAVIERRRERPALATYADPAFWAAGIRQFTKQSHCHFMKRPAFP